jgi:ribosomal protein S18 acetylase RimI-like enzyme
METEKFEIVMLPVNELYRIEKLWVDLNAYHIDKASNFSNRFISKSFEKHCCYLQLQEDFKVYVAIDRNEVIGFCIAIKNREKGEIDAIYVKESARGKSVGCNIVEKAIDWLSSSCYEVLVQIAEGNEDVIDFYRKLNFKLRYYAFQLDSDAQQNAQADA